MLLSKTLGVLFCALFVFCGSGNPLQAAERQPLAPSVGPRILKLDCITNSAHTGEPTKTPAGTFNLSPVKFQFIARNVSTATIPAGTGFNYKIEWIPSQMTASGPKPSGPPSTESGRHQLRKDLPPGRQVVFLEKTLQTNLKPASCEAAIPDGRTRAR